MVLWFCQACQERLGYLPANAKMLNVWARVALVASILVSKNRITQNIYSSTIFRTIQ